MYDLLIKNALIIDGTGADPVRGDIAVVDGLIADIGAALGGDADQTRDASGLAALPGFIDIHRHSDLVPFLDTPTWEEASQGITTFISGPCGFSAAPNTPDHFSEFREYSEPIIGPVPDFVCGMSFAAFLDAVKSRPLPSNMGFLVGNGALRIAVRGFQDGALSPSELDRVRGLLRDSLAAGALGLSTGLMYVPETFYETRELVEIFKVSGEFGRPVFTHIRGEGSLLLDSIKEVLDVADKAGTPLHISHLKAAGKTHWHNLAPRALERIAEARARGRDVTFDVYPYHAGSSAMHTLLPPRYIAGGMQALLKRLADPAVRAEMLAEMRRDQNEWDNLVLSTGWQSVTIAGGPNPELLGRTVLDIARERGIEPEECAMQLMIESDGNLPMVFHSMSEDDMLRILTTPGAIIISDSLYTNGGQPHPRKYGSQARLISHYCLREKKMKLADAVKAMTMLPARRMNLTDRGTLTKGMAADMLLLDLDKYRDTATYLEPVSYPQGIDSVYVNGKAVVEDGARRNVMAGRALLADGS